MNKEQAKDRIKQLIDKFTLQIDYYKSSNYNETQTRRDFIDPFFAALGWDIDNEKQQLETYRDVRHEDKIRINGHTKAPDYSFNINGKRKFFVEAKKPSVSIKDNPEPALQVRNYGWNAKLNISIVFDFEEFAIYDCTKKIRKNDNAVSKRLKYIYFTDYLKEFDFIWDTFAYENVVNESVEKFAKSKIDFKTAEPVDKEFLQSLNNWREYLATTIALRNKELEEEEINFAVQQTIDRIVFLRVCEDRKIEPEGKLAQIAKSKGNTYQNLFAYFQIANQKYNSGLFDFDKDKITKQLDIDNKVVKNIINELYETGYNFAIIPVEILGFAYEQFLGKVIRLTPVHRAVIEEKPEVRKAGGVYYTPDYIVNYIVQNTVGKLIENKTPEEINKIKILDPSCGSGSFLLGAYQYLLDWHLFYYHKHKSKLPKKDSPITPDNALTSKEKKRILLNNIYGVDIDTQAVEVTKLSLLLKALEGETETSIQTSLQLLNERVLPTIDNNIQCGNSLIAPDFYNEGLFFTPKEERKINVFDWKQGFSEVFKQGGFDCIIGNPPYIRIQNIENHSINYFSKYETAIGNFDIYCLFVEKGISLLNSTGKLAFILPHRFFKTDYGEGLRRFFTKNKALNSIFDFDGYYVFESASINTCIIQADNCNKNEFIDYYRITNHKIETANLIKILNNSKEKDITEFEQGQVSKSILSNDYWNFIFNEELDLFNKLSKYKKLGGFGTNILVGLQTSADPVFITKLQNETTKYYEVYSKHTKKVYSFEKEIMFPLLRGAEVKRFQYPEYTDMLIFPYTIENGKAVLIDEKKFETKYPKIWAYLNECKQQLLNRSNSNSKLWWNYTYPKNLISFNKNKIMTTVLSGHNSFTLDREGKFYFVGGGNAGVYGIQLNDEKLYPYILGLLNSKLLNWFHKKISLRCYQTAFSYGKRFIEQLPIKTIDFNDSTEKMQHTHLVQLVETMLEHNQQLQKAKLQTEKDRLQRRIDFIDSEIDNLVYQLYDLTIDEIEIIKK